MKWVITTRRYAHQILMQVISVFIGMGMGILIDQCLRIVHTRIQPEHAKDIPSYMFALGSVQMALNIMVLGMVKASRRLHSNVGLSLEMVATGLFIPQSFILRRLYDDSSRWLEDSEGNVKNTES